MSVYTLGEYTFCEYTFCAYTFCEYTFCEYTFCEYIHFVKLPFLHLYARSIRGLFSAMAFLEHLVFAIDILYTVYWMEDCILG
jgi:hypothetical protein